MSGFSTGFGRALEQASEGIPQGPVTPPPQTGTDFFQRALDDADQRIAEQSEGAMLSTFGAALKANPDMHAEAQKIGVELGVEPEAVSRNMDIMRQVTRTRWLRSKQFAQSNPVLASHLKDIEFARIAHDDVENLSFSSEMFGNFEAGQLESERGMIGSRVRGGYASKVEIGRLGQIEERLAKLPRGGGVVGSSSRFIGQMSRTLPVAFAQGSMTGAGFAGVAAIAGTAGPQAALPEEIVTVPLAFAKGFGVGAGMSIALQSAASEGGSQYLEMVKAGYDENSAKWASRGVGVAVGLLEIVGIGKLAAPVRDVIKQRLRTDVVQGLTRPTFSAAARQFAVDYVKGGAAEVGVETLQTVAQVVGEDIARMASDDPDLESTITQGKVGESLYQTILATAQGMVVLALPGPMTRLASDAQRAKAARGNQKFFESLREGSAKSKLKPRSQDAYQSYIRESAKDSGAETIYVEGSKITEAIADGSLRQDQLEQSVPDVMAALQEAEATGGDVAIPTEVYAAKIAGTEADAVLAPHLRLDPDAMSFAEAEAFAEMSDEDIQAAVGESVDASDAQVATDDSARAVEDIVYEQITATKTMSAKDARAQSQYIRDFVVTGAERQTVVGEDGARRPMTPGEFYAKYPLKVARGAASDGKAAFNQDGQRDLSTPEFKAFIDGTQVIDAAGAPRIVYRGRQGNSDTMRSPVSYFAYDRDAATEYSTGVLTEELNELDQEDQADITEEATVLEAYVSVKNAATAADVARVAEASGLTLIDDGNPVAYLEQSPELVEALKAEGFDGAIGSDGRIEGAGPITSVAVFESGQVKSTNNRGTFDRSDANILRQDAVEQTETPEFKEWFGDSKVVDEAGAPLVVYHGTSDSFESFDIGQAGSSTGANSAKQGFWFTGDSSVASDYAEFAALAAPALRLNKAIEEAESRGDYDEAERLTIEMEDLGLSKETARGQQVVPAFVSMRNPLEIDAKGESFVGAESDINAAIREAKRRGHDGVIVRNLDDSPGNVDKDADHYLAFDPTQIKSTSNRGSFDRSDSNILNQDEDEAGQPPRGEFLPDGNNLHERLTILLGEKADASTFLHESAHYFLTVYSDLAAQPDAAPLVVADMDTLLASYGIEDVAAWNAMTLSEQRKHHEKFAYGFEQYLFDGKAPSAELVPLYQRFSRWIRRVYRNIRDKVNDIYRREFGEDLPILTGEVRGVMDRMLASEEQIAAAEHVRSMVATFQTQEESGLSDNAWEAYQEQAGRATDAAIDALTQKSLANMKWLQGARARVLKEKQAEAADVRAAVRVEVKAEVEQRPIYRAMQYLKRGETRAEDGTVTLDEGIHKLDNETVKQMVGKDLARKLGYGKYGMLQNGGIDPDRAAAHLKFTRGGRAMVLELLDAPKLNDAVEAATDERMLEENSDLVDPDQIKLAVEAAVHNEARARFLTIELKALAQVTQPTRLMTAAAKEAARQILASKTIRELRPRDFSIAEARHGREAYKAVQAGDTAAAIVAKQKQLVQFHLAKQAAEAQLEVVKGNKAFRRVFQSDIKLAKTRDVNIVQGARAVLTLYDLGQASRDPLEWLKPVADYDPLTFADIEGDVAFAITQAGTLDAGSTKVPAKWKSLTLEQYRDLSDVIDMLWNKSRRSKQVLINGKKQSRDAFGDRAIAALGRLPAKKRLAGNEGAGEDAKKGARVYAAQARRMEFVARDLDGGEVGPFTELFRNIKEAADDLREATKKAMGLYETRLKEHDFGPNVAIDGTQELIGQNHLEDPEHGGVFKNKARLIGAMIHLGNDSNKKKALVSEGWATIREDGSVDDSVWLAFERRMIDEGVLNEADFDLMQDIWDQNESLKEALQKAHHANHGYYWNEIDAKAFTVTFKDGTEKRYRGGYAPANADKDRVARAASQDLDAKASVQSSVPMARRGMTKDRNENYVEPLIHDLNAGGHHLAEVLRYVHMQGPVTEVHRVLHHNPVEKAIQAYDPALLVNVITPWLNQSVEQRVGETEGNPAFLAVARMASNTNMGIMFGNVGNALQNFTGLIEALTVARPRFMLGAISSYIGGNARTTALEKSKMLRGRKGRQMVEVRNEIRRQTVNAGKIRTALDWIRENAYFIQQLTQDPVDTIVWTAAYNQHLVKGTETDQAALDREAVRRGDAAVRKTQMATDPEDVSKWESEKAFVRAFFPFQSWFIRWANHQNSNWKNPAEAGGRLASVVYGYALPLILAQLVSDAVNGRLEDEDDDGWGDEAGELALRSIVGGTLAAVPVFGKPAASLANSFLDDEVWNDRMPAPPFIEAFERARQSIQSGEFDSRDTQNLAVFFGNMVGVPVGALVSRFDYALRASRGETNPDGPLGETFDTVRGLVTGRGR